MRDVCFLLLLWVCPVDGRFPMDDAATPSSGNAAPLYLPVCVFLCSVFPPWSSRIFCGCCQISWSRVSCLTRRRPPPPPLPHSPAALPSRK